MKTKNKTNASSMQSLSDIKRKLRKGEQSQIAHSTGYSNMHVYYVLNGMRNNPDGSILKEANRITRRRR